jgi:hypothetical protein
MKRAAILLVLLLAGTVIAWSATQGRTDRATPAAIAPASSPYVTEQHWIVSSVAAAMLGMAQSGLQGPRAAIPVTVALQANESSAPLFLVTLGQDRPVRLTVDDHLWSPRTYAPLAQSLFTAGAGSPVPAGRVADHNVRAALVDLRVEVLLDLNERISAVLTGDMRSAAAHESAALLLGALALRESWTAFGDVRTALSRMAAHLAVADALRGQTAETLDGALARTVLTLLTGAQRDALAIVDGLDRRVITAQDKAWTRALRLRITGDWRTPMKGDATLLERLEQARALRTRVGSDALLNFLDTFDPEDVTDWHRIALSEFAGWFNVESGHRFTDEAVEKELAEAARVWSRLHPGSIDGPALVAALNDRPGASPVDRRDPAVVAVLDWGTWAAFHQRQLSHALVARNHHFRNLGDKESQQSMVGRFQGRFGRLTLFPAVLRSIATTPSDYELSVAGGRALVAASPELVTAAVWNQFAGKPAFVPRAAAFPFFVTWFTPGVPAGTAFDLHARALLPGCPRPPTPAQVKLWAQAVPYDHWTVWSAVYLTWGGSGKPTAPAIFRAFGAMMDYDYVAALKVLDYTPMTTNERIEVAQKICGISTARCDRVALLLLQDAREPEAVAAYERWIASSRDRVGVSTGLTWLVRHYYATGNRERAEELARMSADVASHGGLETLAHLLDASGRYEEAEARYREIASHYRDTGPLGTFLVRGALRTGDRKQELEGWENLRETFPTGMQPLAMHALDAPPVDGVVLTSFGRRVSAVRLEPADIIVGVDDLRVRTQQQYKVATRLRHDEMMTLTIWRSGRYQQLRTRVPERWLGVGLGDHKGRPTAH